MQDENATMKHTSDGIEALVWKSLRMDSTFLKMSRDEKKNVFLFRTLMSQLNKLSHDNCSKIKDKMQNLPIDTLPKLQKAVEIIHEKAIDEKIFRSLYAQVCDLLKDKQFTDETRTCKTFASLLTNRCKEHFDVSLTENLVYERRKFEIDLISCKETRKQQLMEECLDEENESSKRFVGNCFFIAEVFKFGMIEKETLLELIDCLFKLSGNVAAECIYAIFTTVGKFYEDNFGGMSSVYFDEIESLLNEDLLPRVRFLLQDVLDLRRNAWRPRIQCNVLEISVTDLSKDESDDKASDYASDGKAISADYESDDEASDGESDVTASDKSADTASIKSVSPKTVNSVVEEIVDQPIVADKANDDTASINVISPKTVNSVVQEIVDQPIVADKASVDPSSNDSAQNINAASDGIRISSRRTSNESDVTASIKSVLPKTVNPVVEEIVDQSIVADKASVDPPSNDSVRNIPAASDGITISSRRTSDESDDLASDDYESDDKASDVESNDNEASDVECDGTASIKSVSPKTVNSVVEEIVDQPIVADKASVNPSNDSVQNMHAVSGGITIPNRQTSSLDASQTAATSSLSSALSATAQQLNRVAISIFQKYEGDNNLTASIESFERQINLQQRSDAVHEIMEYATSCTPLSAWKCGFLLVNLIERGSITKECVIELMKFFHDRECFSVDRVNFWTCLIVILIPLFRQGCLRINDVETELRKNMVCSEHIGRSDFEQWARSNGILAQVFNLLASALDDGLKIHLLKRLKEDNTDEIIELIDARNNLENGQNSATFVSKLITMICQIIVDLWQRKCRKADVEIGIVIHDTMMKYEKLLKNYINNNNDLQCLLAVHEYVNKASYPPGLLPGILESLYDLDLVSYESFEQWKNSDTTPRFEVALSLLSQFFESIEEVNVQIPAAPKIKYTVEFLTTFRDLPECNKPVQIITKEIAAKVIRTQTNNEKKNVPKVGGFDRATYLKVISNSNSFTTQTFSDRTNKTFQRTVTSPFIQSYSDWDEHRNY